MSDMLDPKDIDAAIEALNSFRSKVGSIISEMEAAAQECKGAMEDDPVAGAAGAELSQALGRISEELSSVDQLISQLEEEKSEAQQISTWE